MRGQKLGKESKVLGQGCGLFSREELPAFWNTITDLGAKFLE